MNEILGLAIGGSVFGFAAIVLLSLFLVMRSGTTPVPIRAEEAEEEFEVGMAEVIALEPQLSDTNLEVVLTDTSNEITLTEKREIIRDRAGSDGIIPDQIMPEDISL